LFNDDVKIYLCDTTNGTNHKNTKLLTTLDNKEYPLVEDVYLPKDTILYHGSKTGDLEIDYNKTMQYSNYHFLYFTEDYNMAKEWALHKTNIIKKSDIWRIPTEYGETLTKITKNNANKRKIISLKTNKTLKIAKYNGPDSSNIWMWINYSNREQLYD